MAVIESPMAGKVIEILVEVGQSVEEDDEVIILEAMKMENPVYAPGKRVWQKRLRLKWARK